MLGNCIFYHHMIKKKKKKNATFTFTGGGHFES